MLWNWWNFRNAKRSTAKFRKFREENQMELEFPLRIFLEFGYTSQGCLFFPETSGNPSSIRQYKFLQIQREFLVK